MANKAKFQAIKGTRDLLPPETELWNRVEQTAREVFGTFGFGEIRPPIFEPTELFARAVGGETDIVSKEMYSFTDRHEKLELPKVMGDYGGFIEKVEKLYDSGEIPRTNNNDLLLTRAKTHWKQYVEHATTGPFVAEGFENLFRMVIAVNALQLGPELSLRPEATASVCRAYIEHNMHAWPQPVKLYYTGPMFRRERPQKGRYRQFYQIGAEVLETLQQGQGGAKDIPKDAAVDAEVIEMVMAFFGRLELQGVQLEINSIGHNAPDCRRGYVEKLKAALVEVKDKLGEDSRRRIETNPLRVLDSKLEHEQAIIATLPRIGDHLCDDCAKHYRELKRQLNLREVKYEENWRLVRGLDYYMRTTFEITAQGLGSQNAVCGGGRYDGLVELLGGPPTKGIGFAIGEDRLMLSLQEAGKGGVAQGRDVYIAWMGEKAQATAIAAARKLRDAGLRAELPPVEQKLGKALGQADKLGARYALILGEDEVVSGQWTLKTLADGSQKKMGEAELVEFLKGARALSG
jgi:histidyl-tRNA synthetase